MEGELFAFNTHFHNRQSVTVEAYIDYCNCLNDIESAANKWNDLRKQEEVLVECMHVCTR